jgi:hypothetical protein
MANARAKSEQADQAALKADQDSDIDTIVGVKQQSINQDSIDKVYSYLNKSIIRVFNSTVGSKSAILLHS